MKGHLDALQFRLVPFDLLSCVISVAEDAAMTNLASLERIHRQPFTETLH